MHGLIAWFARNAVAANLLMVFIFVFICIFKFINKKIM